MADVKHPRRKVVSSYKSGSISSNYYSCTLECGHTVTAYGRTVVHGEPMKAPSSVSCRRCASGAEPTRVKEGG
jgi:hypothetical protein